MEGIELFIQIRAFPSEGRARVHESVLPLLGVEEGGAIEVKKMPLTGDEKPKHVTLSIFADGMVEEGAIRISPEDVAKLAAAEGETVHVQRKPSFTEMISRKVNKTGSAVKEGAENMGESIEKGAKEIGAKILPDNEKDEPEPKREE